MALGQKTIEDAQRAINRAFVNVALKWGVDPTKALHNPVFWHDGALHYYNPISHKEESYSYLRERGLLVEGFNGSFRLNCPFEDLDRIANEDFDAGIDISLVAGLLISELFYEWHELISQCEGVRWSELSSEIIENFQIIGLVESIAHASGEVSYQWSNAAIPILQKQYLY